MHAFSELLGSLLLYSLVLLQSEKSGLSLNPTEGAATTIWPLQCYRRRQAINSTWRQMFNVHRGKACFYCAHIFAKPQLSLGGAG